MQHSPRANFLFAVIFFYLSYETLSACPDGQMLYAKGDILVQDRAKIQDGAIRAEDTVEVRYDAQVKGDLFGRVALLRDRASIQGNSTTSASMTRSSSAVVSGSIAQNTALPPCNLSEKPVIAFGSEDKTVPWDSQATVPPGSYRDLLVHTRGAVRFTPGVYSFRKLILEPDARILVQTGGDVDINVEERMFLDGRIVMTLEGQGTFPSVHIYSNQTTVLQVGHYSRLFGTLTAPKAEVRLLERTTMQGRILADRITVEIDAVISGSLDTDVDGVPDLVENMLGTNAGSSGEKPSLARPNQWFPSADVEQTIVYDYRAFPEYAANPNVPVTLPAGTMTSNLAPLAKISSSPDGGIPNPDVPVGWSLRGRYIELDGSLDTAKSILWGLPIPGGSPFAWSWLIRRFRDGRWMLETVGEIKNGIIYSWARPKDIMVLMENQTASPVLYVKPGFSRAGKDGASWATAFATIEDAINQATSSKKEIWVAEGEYPRWAASDSVWTLTRGIRMYGGFKGHETQREQRKPKVNKTMISSGYLTFPGGQATISYGPRWRMFYTLDEDILIDGFHFENPDGTNGQLSIYDGPVLHMHHGSVTFRNCVFQGLGTQGGAPGHRAWGGVINVNGHGAALTLDSCTFLRNYSAGNGGALFLDARTRTDITHTLFERNSARDIGGVIWSAGQLHVKRSIFLRNGHSDPMGFAREASGGSAIYVKRPGALDAGISVENSVFTQGNTKYQGLGGTILADSSVNARMINCTIFDNYSQSTPAAAIQVQNGASLDLINSVLWDNKKLFEGEPGEIYSHAEGSVTARHCNIKGGISGGGVLGYPVVDRGGNIGMDPVNHAPRFVNPASVYGPNEVPFDGDDGFHIASAGSPLFNRGDESEQPREDILARIRAPRHGMGAYEFTKQPPVVVITRPGQDTLTNNNVFLIQYTVNGSPASEQRLLSDGLNTVIVFRTEFGLTGADTIRITVDRTPPVVSMVNFGEDTVVHSANQVVRYQIVDENRQDSTLVTLSPGLNTVHIDVRDLAGNLTRITRKIVFAAQGQAGPSVVVTSPASDTAVRVASLLVRYTVDGVAHSRTFALSEGNNRLIVDTSFVPGYYGADTVHATLDTLPPVIRITYPGQDSMVEGASLTVQYTVDGAARSRVVTLVNGLNTITLREVDAAGNEGLAIRKVHFLPGGASPIVADARARDTIFSYQLFTLDGRSSHGPLGVPLQFAWKQVEGGPVHINARTSRVAGALSRGFGRLRFELTVADEAGILSSGKDTVTVEVLEPENALDFANALEEAKTNQDGAFTLTLDPAGEASRYTQESSIRLEGSLSGTTGALGVIRWTCNARTGTFQPSGQSWESPALTLDPGDNWITLVYTQGNQIATDRILVSRGEMDMAGFDLNPGVLWADSAMSFKLVVNVDDPAVSDVHLVRITDHEVDLGELVDDGTGEDDFASDRRYTLQFNLMPHADSVYWFRVRANKSSVNSYSGLYTFHPQQKYNPSTFQGILNVHSSASTLFDALKASRSEKAAMDSVANWLIEQPSVAVAGIGPGEKAICWQYTNGVHAMISNAPAGTRGGGKVKTKALSPYQFDQAFRAFDDGIIAYQGAVVPAAIADSSLFDADSLMLKRNVTDSNVTIEHWKNWSGYKAVVVATHGNTFGYDSLSQIRYKPTVDSIPGKSFWAKPYVTLLNHIKADTAVGSKYWNDITSGGKKSYPRIIIADIGYGSEFGLTSKFFTQYNKQLDGLLISAGACRSLYNENLWDALRKNGDSKTAMVGFTDYVSGAFAGKSAEIIFKNLIKGKTLKHAIDSVVAFCGQTGNGFCFVNNGRAWDSAAYLEIRGDSNYTLVPRKGRAWAWSTGQGLYSCASATADTVPNIRNLSIVSAGAGHGLALEVNGTVWGWGWNGAGQLGIAPSGGAGSVPTTNYRSCTPLQVFPGVGYRGISAGASRSLAVDSMGRVWRAGEFTGASPIGWTHDAFGNTWAAGVVSVSPQFDTVAGLSNIVAVSAGSLHNLALRANGEVWSWGGNVSGELGMRDTLPRNTPVPVPGLSNIVAISAGKNPALGHYGSHSLALDRSGRVWAWGENEFGQLGVGDTLDRNAPRIISGLSRIRSISAGVGGSSAVDSTGRLWVWGWNDRGQLALGNTNNQSVPTQVSALSNVASVSHGIFPVILDYAGNVRWSCGATCGNTFVSKKTGSLEVGAGGDEFGLSIAP